MNWKAFRYRANRDHPLTPGPSPRGGKGEVNIRFNSLAPIGGEGARRAGEGGSRMAWRSGFLLLAVVLLLAGCAVGPKYKRPDYPVPTSHRSETALPAAAPTATTSAFGDVKWFDLFRDEKLQE